MTVLFLFADRVLLARPASASGTSPVFSEPLARGARTAPEAVAEALRMTVVPSALTAARMMFSVAPTLGKSSRMSAPVSLSALQDM